MSLIPNRTLLLRAALTAGMCLALVGSAHAIHGPLNGELNVQNDRYSPVTIYVDGQRRAELAPGQAKVLKAVPNGVRVVTTVGPRGGELVDRVSIGINKRSALRIAPRRGTALIKNRSGMDLRVAVDGKPAGVVRRGEALQTRPMRAGNHTLTAMPIGHGSFATPSVSLGFDVVAGTQRTVRLKPFFASLRITNPFPYRVGVFVDGKRTGPPLRANQTIVLDNQLPGRVTITFKRRGDLLDTQIVRLLPATMTDVAPQVARVGDLEIRNVSGMSFRLRVDGQRKGRLAPGRSLVLRDLNAGTVTVVARAQNGRVVERTLRVRPNSRAKIDLTNHAPVVAAY